MATHTTTTPSRFSEEILLNAHAYIGQRYNTTTAMGFTRKQKRIEASFWPERPPLPSCLYMYCPDLDYSPFKECPHILRMVEGLILIRVAVDCPRSTPMRILQEECDYFIYRVDQPSLQRLPNPSPVCLDDDDVGLLPRGALYTVAALDETDDPNVFMLHLFHSEIWSWTSIKVSLEAPQKEFPVRIPEKCWRLLHHCTATVITLGGEGGTMGWVDLWRGILFCDVLNPKPALRGVPLPLPKAELNYNDGRGMELGCPKSCRGIAFIKEKGCLWFVDVDVRGKRLPGLDMETANVAFRFDGWEVTTWSNYQMTNSFDDWKMEHRPIQARSMKMAEEIQQQLRDYKLLRPELHLHNLCVSQPTPSMGGTSIVYLMAGAKFLHPRASILAVDMEKRELQSVAEFGTERERGEGVICRHGSVPRSIQKVIYITSPCPYFCCQLQNSSRSMLV